MAYGAHRFLYNNLITAASMITASYQEPGRVGGFTTEVSGSAAWKSGGDFTGEEDLLFTVQIDSAGTGEIGSSTFRWKTSDTVSGWEASGVATSTSSVTLQDGVTVSWEAGSGADFVLNDIGYFYAYANFGVGNLIDRDRDTYWQGEDTYTDVTLTIDLGSAQQVTAFILQDHNLSDSATVHLYANSADSWGAPAYDSGAFSSIIDPLYLYLDQTYRYWRVDISDASNADGYIVAGELYLGTYVQLTETRAQSPWESSITTIRNKVETRSDPGRLRQFKYSKQHNFTLNFEHVLSADVDSLVLIWEAVEGDDGAMAPIWIHYFYDVSTRLYLVNSTTDFEEQFYRYQIYKVMTLTWEEAPYLRLGTGTIGAYSARGLFYDGEPYADGSQDADGEWGI